jgi:hypothetical protein
MIWRPLAPDIEYALARLREGDAVRGVMRDGSPFWIIKHWNEYGISAYDTRHNGRVAKGKRGAMIDFPTLVDWLEACLPTRQEA